MEEELSSSSRPHACGAAIVRARRLRTMAGEAPMPTGDGAAERRVTRHTMRTSQP